jgi:cytochrome P450
MPGGRFPAVLTEDHARVTAPAGGEPMWVVHRYADLLSVKGSAAWRMANRCETPLTGAEVPGGDPPGHMLGMDGKAHRRLRHTIGHLFTRNAADALRPLMREAAAHLLDQIAVRGTGDLRADYAEPATAATVCAALQVPPADWVPIIRPAGEIAFGVVQPGGGLVAAQTAWHTIWGYYARAVTAKQAAPDGGLVAQMAVAMERAGYTTEQIVRAVATVSNGATALLPVLERALLWLLQHPGAVAQVFLGERTWAQAVREAMVRGALFPVTPPLVAGEEARIGPRRVPEGTLVLPSLASAVGHSRAGAWLAFGPGPHRCPGDELTLAALEEFTGAFFRRYPRAYLTTAALAWRDGPLSTPHEARFAVRGLPSRGAGRQYCWVAGLWRHDLGGHPAGPLPLAGPAWCAAEAARGCRAFPGRLLPAWLMGARTLRARPARASCATVRPPPARLAALDAGLAWRTAARRARAVWAARMACRGGAVWAARMACRGGAVWAARMACRGGPVWAARMACRGGAVWGPGAPNARWPRSTRSPGPGRRPPSSACRKQPPAACGPHVPGREPRQCTTRIRAGLEGGREAWRMARCPGPAHRSRRGRDVAPQRAGPPRRRRWRPPRG